jgi:arylsulfatase
MIRWPGRIPAGRVSDEIVHAADLFPTLASIRRYSLD